MFSVLCQTVEALATLSTPVGHNVFVYVFDGSVHVMGERGGVVYRGEIALLDRAEAVVLRHAGVDGRMLAWLAAPGEDYDTALAADIDVGQYLAMGRAVGSVYATDLAEVTVPVADAVAREFLGLARDRAAPRQRAG